MSMERRAGFYLVVWPGLWRTPGEVKKNLTYNKKLLGDFHFTDAGLNGEAIVSVPDDEALEKLQRAVDEMKEDHWESFPLHNLERLLTCVLMRAPTLEEMRRARAAEREIVKGRRLEWMKLL